MLRNLNDDLSLTTLLRIDILGLGVRYALY